MHVQMYIGNEPLCITVSTNNTPTMFYLIGGWCGLILQLYSSVPFLLKDCVVTVSSELPDMSAHV